MRYIIKNEQLQVAVESRGAEIKSVIFNGQERAWQNDNGAWKDTAPLLFPVCGHYGVTVNGILYDMPPHGFVKKAEFTVVAQTADSIALQVSSNQQTKSVYPYDFTFTVTYRVKNNRLFIEYGVQNTGEKALYFACGGHDSFTFTGEISDYCLRFEKAENLVHYAHDDDGYLTGETTSYGENTDTLVLPSDFLQEGRTLIFKGVQSRKVVFQRKNGEKLAEICFDGFENLLIWRATADSQYVCIEPWTNLPDYVGEEVKELSQKAGVYQVDAHTRKALTREIAYYDGN